MSAIRDAVRVRDVAASDEDAVIALVIDVLAEFGFSAKIGGVEQDLAEHRSRYAAERRGGFWVADVEGRVVGTVAIRPKEPEPGVCELKRLYLHPSVRAHGLGQLLYEHAEGFARAAGYREIWLDSSRRFGKAHRLYERNGFVLVSRLDNDWEDNIYEKVLST
jgi:GNAT superfamily N-acetyltransferase